MTELSGITLPDYLVVIAYFILIIFVGYYFSRTIKMAKDYFAAGNIMPWWLAGTSFFMASFSALLFVIYNEIAYTYGLVAVTICWLSPPTILIGGYFLAHRWRRARIMTPVGFIERRYNKGVHQLFVWTGFPLRMIDNALKIFSTAIVITLALNNTGITFNRFVFIIGIIMIAYTYLGGQIAVMITDFVQAVIIAVAVTVLFVLTCLHIDNFGNFVNAVPDGFLAPLGKPYDWSYIVFSMFTLTLLTYSASWALVQKYNCVRSEQDARKMVYLIAFLKFITPPIFFFPGMAARYILPNLENPRYAYAAISLKILPAGLMGFMLAAMFSATMSTLGSEYNTLSGVLTRDFYKKKIKPDASETQEVLIGRISTLIIGVITIGIAILLNAIQGLNLMDIMIRIFSAFGPPIMIPIITGLLFKYFNARGVAWGMISGMIVGATLVIINMILVQRFVSLMEANVRVDFWLRSGWNSAATMITIMTTLLGMWFGTKSLPTPSDEKERVESFFEDMKKPFEYDKAMDKGRVSPFRIIGLMTLLLGLGMAGIAFLVLGLYHDSYAFGLDLITGILMIILGLIMRLGSKQKGV
ncbi:MAG: hypothetical protein JXB48_23800 [Candidatus Latescibacteria bacterium]|nr:hypothetical protein [Candidatus Latescibacterota bacterium]